MELGCRVIFKLGGFEGARRRSGVGREKASISPDSGFSRSLSMVLAEEIFHCQKWEVKVLKDVKEMTQSSSPSSLGNSVSIKPDLPALQLP
jgi:hypothetical protein